MVHVFATGELSPKSPYLEVSVEELKLIIQFLESAKKENLVISVERLLKKKHLIELGVL